MYIQFPLHMSAMAKQNSAQLEIQQPIFKLDLFLTPTWLVSKLTMKKMTTIWWSY